jgi:hypothetical protein
MSIADKSKMLFLITVLIVSCTKARIDKHAPLSPSTASPLGGQEFTFDNLVWAGYTGLEPELYLTTPSLSQLLQNGQVFKYGYLQDSEVYIKLDTANAWMQVKPEYNYDNTLPIQYLYSIYTSELVINLWPVDFNLVGKRASVKIKFK